VLSPIYNLVHIEKIQKTFDIRLGRNSAPVKAIRAHATIKCRLWAHPSATQSRGLLHAPPAHRSGSTPASIADPRFPPGPPLSLPHIKATAGGKYLPTPCRCFFLRAEVSTAEPHRRLATSLPGHSMIPLVELLLTPSCIFCPRFHDDRAGAPSSTVHPAGDLR
jgi:hypothetical protein